MKNGRTNSTTRRPRARPLLFISYRRSADPASARLLRQELTRAGFDAFLDVYDIEAGEVFPLTIDEALKSCDALLLLVSPGWVEVMKELHDPDDFVRREAAAALARRVPLIPLLLGGARMPKANELPEEIRDLAFRQALVLSDSHWDYDVSQLIDRIHALIERRPGSSFEEVARAFRSALATSRRKAVAGLLVIAAVLLAGAFGLGYAIWNRLVSPRSFDACVRANAPDWRGAGTEIEPGNYDAPALKADDYQKERDRGPGGVPLVVRLTDAGKAVGAVVLKFQRAAISEDSTFRVEKVLAPPCDDVQDFRNDGRPAADKHLLKNWDTLRVNFGGRYYYLRVGDKGDRVLATLTTAPRD